MGGGVDGDEGDEGEQGRSGHCVRVDGLARGFSGATTKGPHLPWSFSGHGFVPPASFGFFWGGYIFVKRNFVDALFSFLPTVRMCMRMCVCSGVYPKF